MQRLVYADAAPQLVRHRDRADDGGTPPPARRRASTPTSSSCGSTASPIRTSRARSPGAGARSSSPAGRCGRAAGSRDPKRSAGGCSSEALALGAEYVDVEWRAGFDELIARTARPAHRPVVARLRRRAWRPRRPRAGDARDRRGRRQDRGEGEPARATACRCSSSAPQPDETARVVLIAMGARGLATRVLAAAILGSAWSYAGRLTGVGQITPDALLERVPLPIARRGHRAVRPRRIADRPFGLARDAQRRVRGHVGSTRCICRCRRPTPTISSRSRGRSA